jgi:hypothetical protein
LVHVVANLIGPLNTMMGARIQCSRRRAVGALPFTAGESIGICCVPKPCMPQPPVGGRNTKLPPSAVAAPKSNVFGSTAGYFQPILSSAGEVVNATAPSLNIWPWSADLGRCAWGGPPVSRHLGLRGRCRQPSRGPRAERRHQPPALASSQIGVCPHLLLTLPEPLQVAR